MKKLSQIIHPDIKIENKEELFEMANLRPDRTGLSKGTVYISTKHGQHGARIKFFRWKPSEGVSASISISLSPEVLYDEINLSSAEIKELFNFVRKNYKTLMKIWDEGLDMDFDEWSSIIQSLEKI